MALVSNIFIDLAAQTASLTATVGGSSVDLITYDNTTREVTFDLRDEILLNFLEFLDFCNQVNIFQTAILFNYNTNIAATKPFGQMIANEWQDLDAGNWNLTISALVEPNVVQYEGTKSSLKLLMIARSESKTLTFPEWIYFLQALNHYRLSIRAF